MTFSLVFHSASSVLFLTLISVLSKTQPLCHLFSHPQPPPPPALLPPLPPASVLSIFCTFSFHLLLHQPVFFFSSRLSSLARLPRSRPVSGAAPCARLRGLTPGQVGVCRARGEVMESVRKAAEMVIEEVRSHGVRAVRPRPVCRLLSVLPTDCMTWSVVSHPVPAPVQKPAVELFHHASRDQRFRQSYEPRYGGDGNRIF